MCGPKTGSLSLTGQATPPFRGPNWLALNLVGSLERELLDFNARHVAVIERRSSFIKGFSPKPALPWLDC